MISTSLYFVMVVLCFNILFLQCKNFQRFSFEIPAKFIEILANVSIFMVLCSAWIFAGSEHLNVSFLPSHSGTMVAVNLEADFHIKECLILPTRSFFVKYVT